ncbi:sensor histidine kinase [Nonomuraea sp. NPDC047897]|uniref:sensor histidine kinase n=1 Tax=Nonomuraea sp. NPDC047897 TaxID=3364346 RepID=UPI00371CF22F
MISAAVRPFALALFRGQADPPPVRTGRLTAPRAPRWLAVLLPFQRVHLALVADLVLAYVLFVGTLSESGSWNEESPLPVNDGLLPLPALTVALPLMLRDRLPLAAWRTVLALIPAYLFVVGALRPAEDMSMPYTMPFIVTYTLVLYSVAVRCARPITFAVWVVSVLAMWIIDSASMPIGTVVVTVTILFGYNVRIRRSATARLVEEERRTQLALGAQLVLEERARIARELHDVVAHHMSVIAIQAEAVPMKAAGDAAQLEAGLAEIRTLSLEALTELRQVLGVLRDEEGRSDTAPQPGLDRVDELVANARTTGLTVRVERSGSLDGLPPAVGLSAYRIVQESLSNAMRHAPGAAVTLALTRDGDRLRLRIANGPGTAPAGAPGAGQGLVGMRERASLLGGTFQAGPVAGGGYEVAATLPVAAAEVPS